MKQRLSILGSTGSIGVQTLDIVAENPELFEVRSLVAGRNWELLARQAIEFDVDSVVIADESKCLLLFSFGIDSRSNSNGRGAPISKTIS